MSAKQIATATVVVLTIVALAALGYLLLDILLLVFLGIVVAAALQPWHEKLCRLGVPKGAAVLLIYLLFLGESRYATTPTTVVVSPKSP